MREIIEFFFAYQQKSNNRKKAISSTYTMIIVDGKLHVPVTILTPIVGASDGDAVCTGEFVGLIVGVLIGSERHSSGNATGISP